MLVVSDTSPLSALIRIDAVHLLGELYGRVVIPPEVAAELVHTAAPAEVRSFGAAPPDWLIVQAPNSSTRLAGLGPGEAAAIQLAHELRAPLLIDEQAGRRIAQSVPWGLQVIGTLAVLEQAAARQLVDLRAVIGRLRMIRSHVSDALIADVLRRDTERKRGP